MQSYSSRPGSSGVQPKASPSAPTSKRNPSPSLRRSSSVSSSSADLKPSKLSERKPSPKPQEKQRPKQASEVQQQWGQLQEDLKRAREELAELKKSNEEPTQSKDMIDSLQSEAEKAKESEANILELLFSQTKQLEQTKILLEEAKLEIRNHQEEKISLNSIKSQEEIKKLRAELRLALEAEEKSKKAMDDFAIALKEVNSELAVTKSELVDNKQKLQEVIQDYHKLKLVYEESDAAWKEKEASFLNSKKISEEQLLRKKEEISKLKDIIKQAVNEATVAKESLEIARYENYELNDQLSKKETALQQTMLDYDSLRIGEAAALASASAIALESYDDWKIASNLKKCPSDRWSNLNPPRAQTGHRHSVGEVDRPMRFEKEGDSVIGSVPSSLFSDGREKKKKTTFRRFGDALRRRSFRKS